MATTRPSIAPFDGQGGPLAIVVAPANVNDHLLLEETIEAIVVRRPRPTESENYLGLLQLACALYWYRRLRAATTDSP